MFVEAGIGHLTSAIPENVRRAEALGFDGVTSAETAHEPFLPLAVAAEHTERVKLRTNVAIAFPRSPHVMANICWDLQEYSKGRFILGLGPQVKGHNERRFGIPWPSPPAPRLREYVLAVKAFLRTWGTGEKLNFVGEHYAHTLMTFNFTPEHHDYWETPIWISALGPAMARVAGEVCEGLTIHPMCSFKYIDDIILPAVEEGARRGGRKLSDITIQINTFRAMGDTDEEVHKSMREAARRISFYGSTRTYQRSLDIHGYKDLNLQLHELSLQNRWGEMHELVTDDVVRSLAIVGTPEEVARETQRRYGHLNAAVGWSDASTNGDEERTKRILEILRS